MKIDHTSTPASVDIDFLTQRINQETLEFGEAYPFSFFVRDENNQIIAGCNGILSLAVFIPINYGYIPIIAKVVWDMN